MSATIKILNDPEGICETSLFEITSGTKFLDWLIELYGVDGFNIPTRIYKGSVCEDSEILRTPMPSHLVGEYIAENKDRVFEENEIYTIVHTPQDLLSAAIFVGALIIGAVAGALLAPNIEIPENPEYDTPKESPNNSLTGQINIARPLERIPDIYGKNRVYPDLIAPSYFEFVANIKFLTEYLCIGRGEFLVEDVRAGETLLDDINGAAFEVFEPDTAPDDILKVLVSDQVNGQELAAPNDAGTFDINANITVENGESVIFSRQSSFQSFGNMTAGDTFDITGTTTTDGTYTFQSLTSIPIGEKGRRNYEVTVSETFTADETSSSNITSTTGKASEYGPFVVPGNPEQIWIDIICPRGLQTIDGVNKTTIELEFDIKVQELDSGGSPVGGLQTFTRFMSANTQDGQFVTFKIFEDDLTNPGQPHEVSVERITNTTNDSTIQTFDLSKWGRLAGVELFSGIDFGDVTTVLVSTIATEQATSIQAREFNAVVTRKLVTYDTGTQTISGSTSATAKVADAALHILTDPFMGNKSADDIDLDQLYEIQDRLDVDPIYGDLLGRFCYSLSNLNTPVQDELASCLNAMKAFSYRQGNISKFVRDEKRDLRSNLFNRRNKSPKNSKKNMKFNKPDDFDSVELQWVDETTGDPSTVFAPEPSGGTRMKRIRAAGIKNYEQAWNRAQYEYLRIVYQRINASETVTKDGLMVVLNDRVANVDGTNIKTQDGEVVLVQGFIIQTNEPIDFEGETSGTVILRSADGEISTPITATARGDDINGFVLSSLPSFSIVVRGENDYQRGSLYSFASGVEDNHLANDYTIQEIAPSGEGYVELNMVNYAPEIYDPDEQVPTPEGS